MSRRTPRQSDSSDSLLRWLLGIAVALAAINLILLIVWGSGTTVLPLLWFSVMVDSFSALAALAIAFVAIGRYRALQEPAPFWIGAAFLSFAIFAVAGILTAPGLLPDGRAIFSTTVNTNGWLWLLMFSLLAVFLLVAVLVRWPRAGTIGERWATTALIIGALVEIGLCVASVVFEQHLPVLLQDGSWTALNTIWTYALLVAFSAGTYLSARRYRQTGDTIVGYVAIAQLLLAFAMLTNILGQRLYDPWFYWRRALWVGGFSVMLFGLLSEYVGLYRRERESSSQLRESEERLRSLFQEMVAGFALHEIILDDAGRPVDYRYVDVNPAFESMTGFRREELIGRTVRETLPGIEEYWIERFGDVALTGNPAHFTDYMRDLDKYFDVTAYSPRRGQFAVTSTDVTEQTRTVAALRESEERFRAIFEQAAVGVAQVAIRDGRFLRANQKLCDIVGYSQDGLLQRTFHEITHPDDLEADLGLASSLVAGEIPGYSLEKRYVRQDGSTIWANITISAVRDPLGHPDYYVAVVEDISQRKAAEQERQRLLDEQVTARRRIEELARADRRRAAELHAILDNMVDGVLVANTARAIVMANDAGVRLFGLVSVDEPGRGLVELPALLQMRHHDGSPIAVDELAASRALAGETVVNKDELIRSPRSQSDTYLRVSAAPITGEDGEIVGAVVVARDVTELTELDRLKEQFIEIAAHELKTPVTIMKGYAQVLSRTPGDLSEPRQRMLDAISRGADRIDRIIIELLDISQLTTGRLPLANEAVDLTQLVRDVVDRIALIAPKRHLRISHAEPVVVRGDRQRLDQVLANLLDNAVKYSPSDGEIDVSLVVLGRDAVVSIADQGVGIPAGKQPGIFQRFYRAHTRTPFDYGGMGVGLYISHEIVARHGGRIWFVSEEGKGSTFSFSLPLP